MGQQEAIDDVLSHVQLISPRDPPRHRDGVLHGKSEAERVISLGRLRLKTFGLQADVDREYAALLRDRYKVDVEYVAGEVGSQEQKAMSIQSADGAGN